MRRIIPVAVLVSLVFSGVAYGQGTLANATLGGRVLDQSGAVIPNVAVELLELNKGTKSTTTSNSEGYYSLHADFLRKL